MGSSSGRADLTHGARPAWDVRSPALVDGTTCWRVVDGALVTARHAEDLAGQGSPAPLDWTTLRLLLAWSWPTGAETPFAGVYRLPAGAEARVTPEGGVELTRHPVLAPEPSGPALPVDLWGALVEQCTRLMSGAPRSAVLLSGGLDSSAVAAAAVAAACRLGQPVPLLLSARYPGLPCDESDVQRVVAEHLSAPRLSVDASAIPLYPREGGRFNRHPLVDGQEEINLALYRMAREEGCALALTGVGGDELFEGHASEYDLARSGRWMDALRLIADARRARSQPLVTALRRALRIPLRRRRRISAGEVDSAGSWNRAALRRVLAEPSLSWRLDMACRTAERAGLRLASPLLGDGFLESVGRMPWQTLVTPGVPKGALRAAVAAQLPPAVVARVRKARFDAYYRHRLTLDAPVLTARYRELSRHHRLDWLPDNVSSLFHAPVTAARFLTAWMALGILEFVATWATAPWRQSHGTSS